MRVAAGPLLFLAGCLLIAYVGLALLAACLILLVVWVTFSGAEWLVRRILGGRPKG